MHKTVAEAYALATAVRDGTAGLDQVEVAVCPPFTALCEVARVLRGSKVALGAQDVFWKSQGAYTGEVSPLMLAELGCTYIIVGHSERRGRFGVPEPELQGALGKVFGDNDDTVNAKARAVLAAGMRPIICVGETLPEKNQGQTDPVVAAQVRAAIAGLTPGPAESVVFAYEPVWAIGTGQVCDEKEANRVCGTIRCLLAEAWGDPAAQGVRVQYGGSVKPDNAPGLFAQPQIDGALVGGASLDANSFLAIVRAAAT